MPSSLEQLQLVRVNGKLSGNQLRLFFVQFARARQDTLLPNNNPTLTWEDIGVSYVGSIAFGGRLHDILKRAKYCLAQPSSVFKKNGEMYELRRQYASTIRKGCYAACASKATLNLLKANPGMRFGDACRAVNKAGQEHLDPSFVFAKRENEKDAAEEVLMGYSKGEIMVQGVRKEDLACQLLEALPGIGRFYAQHGFILYSNCVQEKLRSAGIVDSDNFILLGSGACRLLPLLLQEDIELPVCVSAHPDSTAYKHLKLASDLALRERNRFRAVGLKHFAGGEESLPYCLRKQKGRYIATGESFGDLLCESAQLLLLLMGATKNIRYKRGGWNQGDWSWKFVQPLPRKRYRESASSSKHKNRI